MIKLNKKKVNKDGKKEKTNNKTIQDTEIQVVKPEKANILQKIIEIITVKNWRKVKSQE